MNFLCKHPIPDSEFASRLLGFFKFTTKFQFRGRSCHTAGFTCLVLVYMRRDQNTLEITIKNKNSAFIQHPFIPWPFWAGVFVIIWVLRIQRWLPRLFVHIISGWWSRADAPISLKVQWLWTKKYETQWWSRGNPFPCTKKCGVGSRPLH